jgi:hypothetical protein
MITDANAGKFDMIITKSVSRYARNLIDGIKTARDLLHLRKPVGIYFETETLNTFRPDSEFILSVLLLVAQGESEKKSAAVKAAFQWRCDAEDYLTPVNNLLGYTKDDDGNMVIEPEGAKTVKAIYAMFLNGMTQAQIAKILTSSGKPTSLDNIVWSGSSVMGILKNERYCGDIEAQKTVTTDVLEHKSERNRGQLTLHYKDGHHEGILDAIILRMGWSMDSSYKVFGDYAPMIDMLEFRLDEAFILSEYIPTESSANGEKGENSEKDEKDKNGEQDKKGGDGNDA